MKSEKEKQISYVNGMCGVQKNGIAGLICKGEIETQRYGLPWLAILTGHQWTVLSWGKR